MELPHWRASELPLRFPDRLTSIDGAPVGERVSWNDLPSQQVFQTTDGSRRRGQSEVSLVFIRGSTRIPIQRPILRIGSVEILFFFGLYTLIAVFVLWSGIAVLTLAHEESGSRAYAFWTVSVYVFLVTFYDYHTTAALSPCFTVTTVTGSLGFLWMAYAFPRPPSRHRALARSLLIAVFLLGGAAIGWLLCAPLFHHNAVTLRVVVADVGLLFALVMVAAIVLRRRRSEGRERAELTSALIGLAGGPAIFALGVCLTMVTGVAIVHLFLPFILALLPLSIGWSLVRHNILGTQAVLTRRLLVFPTVLAALGAALIAWLALRSDDPAPMKQLVPSLASGGTFTLFAVALHRLVGRWIFPATREFRPTVQQLAESLTDLSHRDEIRVSIERIVSRWLPSGQIRLLSPSDLDAIDHLPPDAAARLTAGDKLWTEQSPWERHLVVPMRSMGALRGVLAIAPKHQRALFTEEDLSLLDTIAALGAVALHNVEILQTLEDLRRLEVEATRDDKKLTLGLLGAELSHELSHPLKFFQLLLRRGAKMPIDADDVEIGEEEIGRMERMLASLRTLEVPDPLSAEVRLAEPVERALVLLRESLQAKGIRTAIEIPPGCTVLADRDGLVQVFANLLRNAAQAVAHGGSVGVRATLEVDGALSIDVWDDGPGIPDEMVSTLFHRWVTSRARDGGSGLGLSVAQNLINSFAWNITYARIAGRTCFCIGVPADKVVAAPAPIDRPKGTAE